MDKKDKQIANLTAENTMLKKILAIMPGNVYWRNKEGIYLGCNQNNANMLQIPSPDHIKGKTIHELVKKEYVDALHQADEEIISEDQERTFEELFYDITGNPAIYLTRKVPLHDDDGQVSGLMGVSIDITQQKKNEEMLRIMAADRAKSRFLSVASHELRIPLTGILGLVSFLKEGFLTPDQQKDHIQMLDDASQHLLALVNDILDFAKLEAEKFELQTKPFDLKDLVEDIIKVLSATAKSKHLELKFTQDIFTARRLFGDSQALRRILMNLVGNAIKFTEKGSITIHIRCLEQTTEFVTLQFAIQDTGRGIAIDKQKVIFERFHQLEDTYARATSRGGTGLGLAIVKELIELMGGKIWVESELGKGATFYFNLTFSLQDDVLKKSPWAAYAATTKVLIVSDKVTGATAYEQLGDTTYSTAPSNEALIELQYAQHHGKPYQIIMLDEELLHRTPHDLLKEVQSQTDLYQAMPVLLTKQNSQSATEADLFTCINEALSPLEFQNQLAIAWEKWLALDKQKSHAAEKGLRTKRVLLVDDDNVVQFVHHKMLTEFTRYVDTAATAADALSMLNQKNYDLLLVDIGLPDMSGYELIKLIRQRADKVGQVGIIALTGYTGDEERDACLNAGANEVAIKPIKIDALQDLLERHGN